MSIGGVISGSIRGLLIAAAAGAVVFGLLVVFHPFSPAQSSTVIVGDPGADALRAKIASARDALAQTDAALGNVNAKSLSVVSSPAGGAAQIEAQIAAATERRDLAMRHAQAIRDALKSGADLSALAEIRDSVVVGQLLTQQAALDAQIAEQGARLKPNHPTMRALSGQKAALVTQIKAEAAGLAAALESEAKLDAAQFKLLQSQLDAAPAASTATPAAGGTLQAQASAQRSELDTLVDAYFNLTPRTAAGSVSATAPNILSPLNLFVVGVAVIAAAMFQIGLAFRRRRLRLEAAADLARWQRDRDPEQKSEPPMSELRRAS